MRRSLYGFRRCLPAAILTAVLALSAPLTAQDNGQAPPKPPTPPESWSEPEGLLAEPMIIQRVVIFGDRHFANGEMTQGWYIDSFNMIPGAGWLSGGPGYRYWGKNDSIFANASAAISWRGYKAMQGRVEFPKLLRSRLLAGAQVRWVDYQQIAYFGEGPSSLETDRSEYRLKATDTVGYATFRPVKWLGIGAEAGLLKPSVGLPGGLFQGKEPPTQDLFSNDVAFTIPSQPAFVHTETSITADTRDFPGHPTRGGLYRAAAGNFSDRDDGLLSFRRYDVEAAQFLPLAGSRVVLALHGWLVATDTSPGRFVPFYLQPSLGGHNSLRGYADYRFHDRSMLLVTAETRIAMMRHVDAAVFFDAGEVASRVGDLNLNKRSYGFGLRLHSRRQTFARLDLARGSEGWRFIFNLSDPLNLARLTRRAAVAPFVH